MKLDSCAFTSSWKPNLKREGVVWPRSFVPSRTEPPKAQVDVPTGAKGKSETQPILMMLNVSSVRDMDIMLQSVQIRES